MISVLSLVKANSIWWEKLLLTILLRTEELRECQTAERFSVYFLPEENPSFPLSTKGDCGRMILDGFLGM